MQLRAGGEAVHLGGPKPYGLLTMLLLSPGQAVPTSRLIDGLWGDAAPRTAAKMLQVYVSRIRQRMADSAVPGRLRTTPFGYALDVEAGELDLATFESLTSRGRLLCRTDPAAAASVFAQALALWSGNALENVLSEPFAEPEAARLTGLRLATLEARFDAEIAAGRGPELVEELQQQVQANPTREHMAAQLMVALYRAGRQADALQVARTLRTHLDDELGLAPGPAVRQLELAILRQDDDLDPRPAEAAAVLVEPAAVPTATVPIAPTREPAPATASPRSRVQTFRWIAVPAAIALVGWLVVAVTRGPDGAAPPPAAPLGVAIAANSLVVVDGATESVRYDIPLGGSPAAIAASGSTAWVGNTMLSTVSRVDLRTGAAAESYGLPTTPVDIVATTNDVWVGNAFDGTVTHVLPDSRVMTEPFFPDGEHTGLVALAADDRRLYSGLPDGRLVTLQTGSLTRIASTRLRDRVALLALSGSRLCVTYFRAATLDCLDTKDDHVLATAALPLRAIGLVAYGNDVWALAGAPASLWHLDLGNPGPAQQRAVPHGATALAVTPGYVWVLYGADGKLMRLPTHTGAAATLDLGRPATGLSTSADQVLVTVD